ncbi:DUF4250 domain-containing protein [Veronia pacifica]|uniref:DUF4250 domain-containing protein n=1 Tax=Veronia pacifica TaxID=1080227 RepID=A0A1C3EI91_9GAMM|nr:DUF4250 domain-containing protein [Veronia pacifica]ODA32955.1 hypothetical protein A8L45_12540 [Veronia pacifica]
MDLKNFASMDPIMLMSIVNMKLRDDFSSLEDLASYFEIDMIALCTKLAEAGFEYQKEQRQFR